jgi:uncharacterized protein (DUF58 family)
VSTTARTFVLVALIVALAIVGQWSTDTTLRGLWRVPAAFLLLAIAAEAAWLRVLRFELRVRTAPRVYLGRPLPAYVALVNASRGALAAQVGLAIPRQLMRVASAGDAEAVPVLTLRARRGETTTREVWLVPIRLGHAEWPTLHVRVLGALGLVWWSRRVPQQTILDVAPDLLRTTSTRATTSESGIRAGRTRGAGAELHQLRSYQQGDPPNRIDWKASARRGELITREFTEDQHLDVVVALDAGRSSRLTAGRLDRLGTFANVAARFAEHAVAHDDRVALVVYAERVLALVPPTRGRAGVIRVRAALESSGASRAESSPLAAALEIRSLARHRSLVVLLTDLDDVTTGGELARAVHLLQSKHLVIVAGVSAPEIDAMATAEARRWLDPYTSLAAREWQARTRAQLASLRKSGTPVIAARPTELEAAILDYYTKLRRERRV